MSAFVLYKDEKYKDDLRSLRRPGHLTLGVFKLVAEAGEQYARCLATLSLEDDIETTLRCHEG